KARELLPQFGQKEAPLAWYELKSGAFVKHVVSPQSWGHGIGAGDVNGDGRTDILTPKGWFEAPPDPRNGEWKWHPEFDLDATGKRYMAHNGHDPGEREPLGIYWYEYMKTDDGKSVEWVKHVIDYGSRTGGGMQIPVVDLDGDGDLDFVVPGKSGLFLFENLT